MNLLDRTLRFHLSTEGRKALRGLVPATGSFQARVVSQEELGLLVNRRSTKVKRLSESVPVMLLRWDNIATMTFDYQPGGAPTRPPIGFREI